MLVAIIGTLLQHEIVSFDWILVGSSSGSAIGVADRASTCR